MKGRMEIRMLRYFLAVAREVFPLDFLPIVEYNKNLLAEANYVRPDCWSFLIIQGITDEIFLLIS